MHKKMLYLTLQSTEEGQAAHAHVHEICDNLSHLGVEVDLGEPKYKNTNISLISRIIQFALVQGGIASSVRKADLVYIRSHFAALPTSLWARACSKVLIHEVNGPYEDIFLAYPSARVLAPLLKWMVRIQLGLADGVICVTPELARWVARESGNENVTVVPNGVNVKLFRPEAREECETENRYVIFFGALAEWQGIEALVEAAKSDLWPEGVYLLIVGDGHMRQYVEHSAKNCASIRYIGRRPYSEMPGLVAGSIGSISAQNNLNGRSDTGLSPLKLYESLACGVPVVVSDLPGLAQVVESHGCGIVVPVGDSEALARAVSLLAHDPDLRLEMGKRAESAAVSEYSWSNRAKQTLGFINSTIGKKTTSGV